MSHLIEVLCFAALFSEWQNNVVFCTIDVNLSELEYLAARLNPFECRRLVAALHYTTFELPKSLAAAEIPCVRLLLHWNSATSEGQGRTHQDLEHRLRQLNRNDLADWLGKVTFQQLGKDLERSIDRPFGELGQREEETSNPTTIEPIDELEDEDPWLPIDTFLLALLTGLTGTLCLLIAYTLLRKYCLTSCKKEITESIHVQETLEKTQEEAASDDEYKIPVAH